MNYYNEIDPFAVGDLVTLAGLAEPVEVVWVVGDVAGVRVPWQRAELVIATRYLRPRLLRVERHLGDEPDGQRPAEHTDHTDPDTDPEPDSGPL